jgi:hypothetical protein
MMEDTLFLKLKKHEACLRMDQQISFRFMTYVSENFKICKPINL